MDYGQQKNIGQTSNQLEMSKLIKKEVETLLPKYMANQAFTAHKITDTPTDAYNVVPRQFVTANGSVAGRPLSSVASVGQPYFASDTGIPMTYSVEGWRNGVGSIVALNN